MEAALLSPSNSKLREKESALKMRYGSPKLQQVLRERCRQQMKLKRGRLFNNRREGLDLSTKDVQETLTEIVRKEFDSLATSDWIDPDDPIFGIHDKSLDPDEALELESEIIAEQEQWILEEYEKMSREELEFLALAADAEDNLIICPICQKFNVIEDKGYLKCEGCKFQLNSCNSIKFLGHALSNAVELHSNTCSKTPGFTLIPDNGKNNLYMVCQNCSLFMSVI